MKMKRVIRLAIVVFIILFLTCGNQLKPVFASNPSIVENGDFELGNFGFFTDYLFSSNVYSEGTYAIDTNPRNVHSNFGSKGDHTTGSGNMMIINGSSNTSMIVWQGTVTEELIVGKEYDFSVWTASAASGSSAILSFAVDSDVVGTFIPDDFHWEWQRFMGSFIAKSTHPVLTIRDNQTTAGGNDFVLDDINIYEVGTHTPPSVGTIFSSLDLTTNQATIVSGENITLEAIVTGNDGGSPTGMVDFYSNETYLGASELNGNGIAEFSTNALPDGTNLIQAEYQGDGIYSVQSDEVTIVVGDCLTPTVSSVTPMSSDLSGGLAAIITGTNFQQTNCSGLMVTVGKVSISNNVVSDTEINIHIPSADFAGVPEGGWVNIAVTNMVGTGSLTNGFVYYANAPVVTDFEVPNESTDWDIPINVFNGSGSLAISSYMVTTSSVQPTEGSVNWSLTAPTSYSVGSDGVYMLYPWVKDEAGNISLLFKSPQTVRVDSAAPELTMIERHDPMASLTNLDELTFYLTFNEEVMGIKAEDLVVNGGSTASVSNLTQINSTTYAATVSGGNLPTYNGQVGLDLGSGQDITDIVGNPLPAGDPATDEIYEVDHIIPMVVKGGSTWPVSASAITNNLTEISVQFTETMMSDGSEDAANNVNNYILVEAGQNGVVNTIHCLGGAAGNDREIVIDQVVYDVNNSVATLAINSEVPLPEGKYKLFICGSTTIYDLAGNALNGGSDTAIRFLVDFEPDSIPSTGFPMGQTFELPSQSVVYSYQTLMLEIPKLGVSMDVVGVPQNADGWNVTWLGDQAGWLEGSAFPTFAGNSVITGHVWDAFDQPGPFNGLKNLKYGDQIIVHAWGEEYIYEIQEILTVRSDNVAELLKHQQNPWMTLVTCKGFNPVEGIYQWRLLVRAVLVDVQ